MNRLCEPGRGLTRLKALWRLSLVEPRGVVRVNISAAVILVLTVL